MEKIKFEEVQNLLDSGKQPEKIFDWVDDEFYGVRIVELNNKENYLDKNNKLLSPDLWFDNVFSFYQGGGIVELNGKWNRIRSNGDLVFDKWIKWKMNTNSKPKR